MTFILHRLVIKLVCVCILLIGLYGCQEEKKYNVVEDTDSIIVETENYNLIIIKDGFRYGFQTPSGTDIASAHKQSGIQIAEEEQALSDIKTTKLLTQKSEELSFEVETESGIVAILHLWTEPYSVKMQVNPEKEGQYTIIGRTNGITPAYGLADHAVENLHSTDVTGYQSGNFTSHGGQKRMISNFVIFPKQGFATINIEPSPKIVRVTEEENTQGVRQGETLQALYYFFGSPHRIYQSLKEVREAEGYPLMKPKYEFFGVGWEAFGALAWNTNEKSVRENVDQYLDLGFPLKWMVVGSGFWPGEEGEFDEEGFRHASPVTAAEETKNLQATTSFGMWDHHKYPDPKEMIDQYHDQGLKFFIGLRIGFIPGGPFTDEGLDNNYFIKNKDGEPLLFDVSFPVVPVYLLDTRNQEAVDWYVKLSKKWMDYGVDGFKEDLFGYPQWLPNNLIDPVNRALMDQDVYVMGRNMYFGSSADLHRFNDFNYNQFQDRGPINGLAYAYSGFPFVYPDIVGGTGLATGRFGDEPKSKLRVYLMRYAEYAALNPSMSFGFGPWNFDKEVVRSTRNAALLHDRLHPYIYSNAIRSYHSGFPWTMTPLPLAYPDDPDVYELADTTRRSYQWLIGESLLATPLYGDDYATADSRDVYLPEGTWIEYDSGKLHQGPTTLKDYPLPIGKTPLFVGGTGIVVEKINGQLVGRLYPVTNQARMIFYDKDGETQSTLTIDDPDWEMLTIIDQTTGEQIEGNWNRHAYEFVLIPGHDYIIN